jgi:hypothetical protein
MEPNSTVQILEKGLWKNAIFLEVKENDVVLIELGEKKTEIRKGKNLFFLMRKKIMVPTFFCKFLTNLIWSDFF